MSVSAAYNLKCDVMETLSLGLDLVTNPTVAHTIPGFSGTLTASTTVPATLVYSDTIPLVGGVYTIDLTDLPGPNATSITFNGLRLQLIKLSCPATNANSMNFAVGAAEPYNFLGAAADSITLTPGAAVLVYYPDGLVDIVTDVNDKIDVAGTLTQEFSVLLVAG